ncbi:MAG: ribosome maturation factor RimM [Bacteriovoracales bacterium]
MSKLMHNNNEYVQLGYISGVHGIKGGVVFTLFNPEESILKKGNKVFLKPKDSEGVEALIKEISFGNKVIVYLEGINDRDQAEKMISQEIYLPRSSFPEIDASEYYLADLVGLEIFDHQSKKRLGKILGFFENRGQVILSMVVNGEKMELPFTQNFFPVIDVVQKRIEMNVPEFI